MNRRLPRRAMLVAALAGVPGLAMADGVAVRPMRDVVVTYRVDGPATGLVPGGLNGPVTLSWDAAGQRVRAEAVGRSQVALVDLRQHDGSVFDTSLRVVLPLPMRGLGPLTLDDAKLSATGRAVVAGLGCTEYSFQSPQGPGTVCLTADGVPLKGEGAIQGKMGRFTATGIRYGAVPQAMFAVPPGYVSLGGEAGPAADKGGLGGLAQRLQHSGIDLRGLLGHSK